MNQMTEHDRDGVVFRTADAFTGAGGVIHGFSTRFGGVSDGIWTSMNLGTTRGDDPDRVRENYRRFFGAVGANLDGVVMSNQIHGTEIRVATAEDIKKDLYDPEGYEVDGLMTDVPGLALVIFSADCLPILLYDPVCKAIGAVHAGWRGTAQGIAAKAVDAMVREFGCERENICAAIGPCIGKCCFETDWDVPQAMLDALGPKAITGFTQQGEKYYVDNKFLNMLWLQRAGIGALDLSPDCTKCSPDRYWSHRVHGGHRGSQAGIIMLK